MKKEQIKKLVFKSLEAKPHNIEIFKNCFEISSVKEDFLFLEKKLKNYIKNSPFEYIGLKLLLLISLRLNKREECYLYLKEIIKETSQENTSALAISAYLESEIFKSNENRVYFNTKRDVKQYNLDPAFSDKYSKEIISSINNSFTPHSEPKDQSVKKGSVRYLKLGKNNYLDNLFFDLNKYVNDFISSINESSSPIDIPDLEDLYPGFWTVSLKNEGNMLPHFHPRGIISGVIYLQLEKNSGGELFMGCEPSGVKEKRDLLKIKTEPFKLVLFPSYYFHRTSIYVGKKERICLSFDFMTENQKMRNY